MKKIFLCFLISFNCFCVEELFDKIPSALKSINCEKLMDAASRMKEKDFLTLLRFNLELSKISNQIKNTNIATNILRTSHPDFLNRLTFTRKSKIREVDFLTLAYIFPGVFDLKFLFPMYSKINDDFLLTQAIDFFKNQNKTKYNVFHGANDDAIVAYLHSLREEHASKRDLFVPSEDYKNLKEAILDYTDNLKTRKLQAEKSLEDFKEELFEFYKYTREFETYRGQSENLTDKNIKKLIKLFLIERKE